MGVKLTKIEGQGSGTGGITGITFKDENTLVATNIKVVNIVGSGHRVAQTGTEEVTIYSPEATYVSYFNTTFGENDCTVQSLSTTIRYVSNPTSEGDPFKLGTWLPGTLHPSTNATLWNYTTTNQCLFDNLLSTINVKVYDADGTSILAQSTSLPITDIYDNTENNIRIIVSSWASENDKYKAVITIVVDMSAILPSGGRVSLKITHLNGGVEYVKNQTPIFFDPNNILATISNVSITDTIGHVVTKFLSGVEYYTLGSQFTVDLSGINNLNNISYPEYQVNIIGYDYGLSSISLRGSDLTGWDNTYNNINDSYTKTNWTIDIPDYIGILSAAHIDARTIDWIPNSLYSSTTQNILVHTRNNLSTRLIEYFDEESWRCPSSADFDSANAKLWDSQWHLDTTSACFINGGCERNITNFETYYPNPTGQPNYSDPIMNTEVFLYREFNHNEMASSNFRLNITGTYNSIKYKLAKAYDGTASGGTIWIDALKDFNTGDWNNGDPQNNSGGRVGSGTNYIDLTFGTNNIINCANTLYIKIGFTEGQRITTLSVNFV